MKSIAILSLLFALSACVSTPPPNDAALPPVTTFNEDGTEVLASGEEPTDAVETGEPMDTVALQFGDNPDISDSQDFSATTGRETIESDAERLAQQREQFQLVDPTTLPIRNGNEVNVAAYALQTTNAVGEQLYRRSPLARMATKRACAKFIIQDEAQEAFLKAGGPKKDPKSLDADGDGFACAWSPERYRQILN